MKLILSLLFLASSLAGSGQSYSVESRKGTQRTVYNRGGISSFSVETRGTMEVTDDDKDIRSMSPDGYLEITKTVFGSKRTIVISPTTSGLKKEYYEGRTAVPFEPEGRKWLGEILPEIVRTTTLAAESRVNRIYRNSGVNGVLNEIRAIESDYVRVHYANILVTVNQPSQNLPVIVAEVASVVDSDHYLTEFLTRNLTRFANSKEAMNAVFAATGSMDSDHYKTEVIKESLELGTASLDNVTAALEATDKMESDHYKTEVLTSLLRQANLTDAVIAAMVNTTKGMESDHYRTVVLTKALAKPGLSATSFQRVLETVKIMESDHYKTEVLNSLLGNSITPDVQTILIAATSSIESDHYITVVGKQILRKVSLSEEAFKSLLEVMSEHQSDYYRAEFLKVAAGRVNLSKASLLAIIQAAGSIESDHYITDVLTTVAPLVRSMGDSSLKDAYRATAKKISSETYYGRALRAID
jgi:hypothetical protein